MKKSLFLFFSFCFAAVPAFAAERPVNLALLDPVQIFDDTDDISGFRFNLLYGKNETVKGLDLGIGLGHSKQDFKGVGLHYAANFVQGDASGIQLANGLNLDLGQFSGFQLAACNFVRGDAKGIQLGYASVDEADFSGVQIGIVNIVHGSFSGLQLGLVNIAGIENGLQIGLVNINKNKKPLPFFPIVNFRF